MASGKASGVQDWSVSGTARANQSLGGVAAAVRALATHLACDLCILFAFEQVAQQQVEVRAHDGASADAADDLDVPERVGVGEPREGAEVIELSARTRRVRERVVCVVVVVVVGGWSGVDARAPISSSHVDVRKCDARIDAFFLGGGGALLRSLQSTHGLTQAGAVAG